jgi:hypothetical protein
MTFGQISIGHEAVVDPGASIPNGPAGARDGPNTVVLDHVPANTDRGPYAGEPVAD